MGVAEARRAFHDDARWKSGPIYVYVTQATSRAGTSRRLVFPPDPPLEGSPWDLQIDIFGSDLLVEIDRVVSSAGEGWVYYAFPNPETGATEPKISCFKGIEWNGITAAIGAGIYRSDLPGTCGAGEVNATRLAGDPTQDRLQEFVRCAAMELESKGYFAVSSLSSDPRWRDGLTYLFGLDTYGNGLFSGHPFGRKPGPSDLGVQGSSPFGDRDLVKVADVFGETFLHHAAFNPAAGAVQTRTVFVKRAVLYGLPVLVASGMFLDESPEEGGEGQRGELGESGTQYGLSDTARESRGGVNLVLQYDSARRSFTGTVTNTTVEIIRNVRVGIHLSNGVELGPTPNVELAPGQSKAVELDASSQTFTQFTVHVEIGSGEGGSEHGGEGGSEGGREGGGEHGSGREGGGG